MENLFEKGCLLQLSVSQWGATRKIDKNRLAELSSNPEWLRASKKLVDPEALKPICKVGNAARNWLKSISLPFPIPGMLFVPKDIIGRVDDKLTDFRDQFNYEVEAFTREYDHLCETARLHLEDLFSDVDYPVDIRNKFGFAWRFIILDVPNGHTGVLAPEVYEREKEKFIQTMEEARIMAIEALREEFSSMVERITDRFTEGSNGKPKIFKSATVDSFYEYFQTFKDRNIFLDADLSQLVDRAQEILDGRTVDDIRSDESLKSKIREGMTEIEKSVSEIFNRPRRRIVMD